MARRGESRARIKVEPVVTPEEATEAGKAFAAGVSSAAKAMALVRLAQLGPEGRRRLAKVAGFASWRGMTAAERSLEMRRRCVVRRKNRLKKKNLRVVK